MATRVPALIQPVDPQVAAQQSVIRFQSTQRRQYIGESVWHYAISKNWIVILFYLLHIIAIVFHIIAMFLQTLLRYCFETLEEILLPDEIHLLHILNDVKLKVRVGADYGPEFTTSFGIMQGDCLSAVLFILYLAKALSSRPPLETELC